LLIHNHQSEQLQPGHAAFITALERQRQARGLAASSAMRRLSMKINPHMAEDFLALQQQTHMNQTDLLKSVIARIQADVLETRDQDTIHTLQRLARLAL
jgi:hypothetical protein